eukprot:gene3960-2249_t
MAAVVPFACTTPISDDDLEAAEVVLMSCGIGLDRDNILEDRHLVQQYIEDEKMDEWNFENEDLTTALGRLSAYRITQDRLSGNGAGVSLVRWEDLLQWPMSMDGSAMKLKVRRGLDWKNGGKYEDEDEDGQNCEEGVIIGPSPPVHPEQWWQVEADQGPPGTCLVEWENGKSEGHSIGREAKYQLCYASTSDPAHPIHEHALCWTDLQPIPEYQPNGSFECNRCGLTADGFSYHCNTCMFDLCPACFEDRGTEERYPTGEEGDSRASNSPA